MLHGQRLQFGDDLTMPAGTQVGLDARLESGETDLVEPGRLGVQGAVGFDVGVRVAPPHRQRGPQPRRGAVGIRHRRRRPVGLLEFDAVDVAVGERQQVGVALAHDDIAEHLTQVRHVRLERAAATQRSLLAVHRLEQNIHRHRASGRGDQHRNHYPLLGTAQRERNSVDEDFQRAKDPIVHRENVPLFPALEGGNLHRAHRERTTSRSAQARALRETGPSRG